MSIPAFGWAQHKGAELNLVPSARLILQYLASASNTDGISWPGQPTIRKYTGLALRTIREQLPKLEAAGLIAIIAKVGCATHYRILRPINGADPAPPPRQSVAPSPRQDASGSPADGIGVPPANGAGVGMPDPATSPQGPSNITARTPADRCPETYRSKIKPKSEAVFDSDFGRKEVAAAPPVPERELTAREVEAARAKAAAELAGLPEGLRDVFQSLGKSMGGVAYAPGRSSPLDRDEQLAMLRPPRPAIRPAYLTREQLARSASGAKMPA